MVLPVPALVLPVKQLELQALVIPVKQLEVPALVLPVNHLEVLALVLPVEQVEMCNPNTSVTVGCFRLYVAVASALVFRLYIAAKSHADRAHLRSREPAALGRHCQQSASGCFGIGIPAVYRS